MKIKMSNIAAQLWTIRKYAQTFPDFVSSMQRISRMGYPAIQLSGVGPIPARDIARAVKGAGLRMCATHVSWEKLRDRTEAMIEDHLLWECPHVAIGALPDEYRNAEGLKRFCGELPSVVWKLRKAGLDFSYHNHSHEFVKLPDGRTWLEALYADMAKDILLAELDLYWVQHGRGNPAQWIKRVADRSVLLHLKDMKMVGNEPRFAEIGEGCLKWDEILKAAEASRIEWYIVEQDECYGRNPFDSLAISLKNLQSMVAGGCKGPSACSCECCG